MQLIATILYAFMLFVASWRRPSIALMAVFATAPFQNDLSGGDGPVRFSLAEISLIVASTLFLLQRRPFTLGPIALPVGAYLAIGLAASLLEWRDSSLVSLVQVALYYVVAVGVFANLARTERDYIYALNALVVVGVILSLATFAGGSGFVLGLHKNGIGASIASAAIVGTELFFAAKRRSHRTLYGCALAVTMAGLLFTLSRGAWMAAVVGIGVILVLRSRLKLALQVILLSAPLLALCWSLLPGESRAYAASFSRERNNIEARFWSYDYAWRRFETSPVIGVGVGLRKEYDATNLVLLTLAETGVVGALALISVHAAFFSAAWKTHKHLRQDSLMYSLVAVGSALVAARLAHGMVDHYWSRGAIMLAWAAAGMTIRARAIVLRHTSAAPGRARAVRAPGGALSRPAQFTA